MPVPAEGRHGAHVDVEAGQRQRRGASRRRPVGFTPEFAQPAVEVELAQAAAHPQARPVEPRGERASARGTELHQRLLDGRAVGVELAPQRRVEDAAVADGQRVGAAVVGQRRADDAQRGGAVGRLAERRRQVDRGSPERALDRPHRGIAAEVQRQRPGQRPGEAIGKRQAELTLQLCDAGGPRRGQPELATGATDRDLRRPARHLCRNAGRRQVGLGERQRAVDRGQRRHAQQTQFRVVERERAGHLVVSALAQQQIEPQREPSAPGTLGPVGHIADPAGDGAVLDIAQEIGDRTRGRAVDDEARELGVEVRDHGARATDLGTEVARRAGLDHHALAFETDVGVDVGERRPALGESRASPRWRG